MAFEEISELRGTVQQRLHYFQGLSVQNKKPKVYIALARSKENSYDIIKTFGEGIGRNSERDRQMDGQTGRQTDRHTQNTKFRTLDLKLRARFDWPMEMLKESKFHENRPRSRMTVSVIKSHKRLPF